MSRFIASGVHFSAARMKSPSFSRSSSSTTMTIFPSPMASIASSIRLNLILLPVLSQNFVNGPDLCSCSRDAMLHRRKLSGADLGCEARGGLADGCADVGVALRMSVCVIRIETEQVMEDLDLAVTMRPGPDADGGYADRFGDTP